MMKMRERVALALGLFEQMAPARDAVSAMDQLRSALKTVETEHSGFPDYSTPRGYAGEQLHLYAYSAQSPFWKPQPDAESNLVCQLTGHYAVFGCNGGVAIFTRDNCFGRKLVFCKPAGFFAAETQDIRLWP